MRRLLPFALLAFVVAAFLVGRFLRSQMGIEYSAQSIRGYVLGLGITAPLIYVALVTFRQFLLLPSMIVLTAGGLVFGAALGTVLGATGIVASALMKFTLARGVGREWVRPRMGEAIRAFERRVEAAGPVLVGVATAHPMGPMSPSHWAAGFASMAWPAFLLAVVLAGPVRAFAYSFFGANLLEPGSTQFWVATGVLLGVAFLPLAHPAVRRRLLGNRRN